LFVAEGAHVVLTDLKDDEGPRRPTLAVRERRTYPTTWATSRAEQIGARRVDAMIRVDPLRSTVREGLRLNTATTLRLAGRTQVASAELAHHQIRVNATHPDAFDTPTHQSNTAEREAELLAMMRSGSGSRSLSRDGAFPCL